MSRGVVIVIALAGLFAGCGGGDPGTVPGRTSGATVFDSAGCGGCHTFGPAGATGAVASSLDRTRLGAGAIADLVRGGTEGMPAFGEQLSDDEVAAVARYVAGSSR